MLQKILVHIWLIIIFSILFFCIFMSFILLQIDQDFLQSHTYIIQDFLNFVIRNQPLTYHEGIIIHIIKIRGRIGLGSNRLGAGSSWCRNWKNYPSPMWWIPKWQNCVIQEQNKRYWQQKKLFNDNEKILTNDYLLYLNGQCGSACPMS